MHWGVWLRVVHVYLQKKKTKIVFTFRTVQTVVNNEPVASDYFLSHKNELPSLGCHLWWQYKLYWNTDWWWFKEMTLALANLKIPWSMWILSHYKVIVILCQGNYYSSIWPLFFLLVVTVFTLISKKMNDQIFLLLSGDLCYPSWSQRMDSNVGSQYVCLAASFKCCKDTKDNRGMFIIKFYVLLALNMNLWGLSIIRSSQMYVKHGWWT